MTKLSRTISRSLAIIRHRVEGTRFSKLGTIAILGGILVITVVSYPWLGDQLADGTLVHPNLLRDKWLLEYVNLRLGLGWPSGNHYVNAACDESSVLASACVPHRDLDLTYQYGRLLPNLVAFERQIEARGWKERQANPDRQIYDYYKVILGTPVCLEVSPLGDERGHYYAAIIDLHSDYCGNEQPGAAH